MGLCARQGHFQIFKWLWKALQISVALLQANKTVIKALTIRLLTGQVKAESVQENMASTDGAVVNKEHFVLDFTNISMLSSYISHHSNLPSRQSVSQLTADQSNGCARLAFVCSTVFALKLASRRRTARVLGWLRYRSRGSIILCSAGPNRKQTPGVAKARFVNEGWLRCELHGSSRGQWLKDSKTYFLNRAVFRYLANNFALASPHNENKSFL